jgi:hydrogenase maturation protease
MTELRTQLRQILSGRVCLVGLGNVERGDDGWGVRLAEEYATACLSGPERDGAGPEVVLAGTQPERELSRLTEDLDAVVFLDAVDFGGAPGAVVLLDGAGMRARYPQVSTHRLSLGLLAQLVESGRRTRAWLLGVQPESLRQGAVLSTTVRATVNLLRELITECLPGIQTQNQIA